MDTPVDQTTLQQQAEVSIETALRLLLQTIPSAAVFAVYLKGSFVQHEMRPESDVDIVVILADETYLPTVYTITDEYGTSTHPPFQMVAYTLQELQTGERATNRTRNATSVSRFVKHLDSLPLIYGEKPAGPLFMRSDKKDLQINIQNFRHMYLPDYAAGTFGFSDIIKQVFWLVEAELRFKGIDPGYSWRTLATALPDPTHLIHLALTHRNQPTISDKEQADFMKKLEAYLRELEQMVTQ